MKNLSRLKAAPEDVGIASSAVLAFIDAAEAEVDALHSFMLLRHGKVAAEGWWTPYEPDAPHMLFSLSKSFTSTAVGLAVDEGLLSVDDEVISFFPEETPDDVSDYLAAMRVRHLLTMTTGHSEAAVSRPVRQDEVNWARAFLETPVEHEPGTHFVYNSGASYMLSAIVQKLTGRTLLDYLQPRLFEPLGIEGATWETCPRGINTGGWGLSLRTRDIARFGQLYLQKGTWAGEQLVPSAWIEAATAAQVDNAPNDNPDWEQGYGYQFWRCRHNAYRGDGAFGQFCVVMPDQDAVFAATAGVGDMQAVLDLVWDHLLPAMASEPLPSDEGAYGELREKLEGLTLPTVAGAAASESAPAPESAPAVSGTTYVFEPNDVGLREMRFDFDEGSCVVTMHDELGEHRYTCGHRNWVSGSMRMAGRTGGDLGVVQPIAASGAWQDDRTYVMKVYMTATPFRRTATCRFEDDRLILDSELNVGFGPTEGPRLVGAAS
jgi:CubicO group peptidase (beta-lactamase class C family)